MQLLRNTHNNHRPLLTHDHEIHSLGGMCGQLKLDFKLTRIDKHLYQDSAPETWRKNVRTYLLGTHPDMVLILDWIGARGDH